MPQFVLLLCCMYELCESAVSSVGQLMRSSIKGEEAEQAAEQDSTPSVRKVEWLEKEAKAQRSAI